MGKNYCNVEKKWCKFCKHNTCFWSKETLLKNTHRCPKRESTRTIRLKDMINDVSFMPVMKEMLKWWPDQAKNMFGYFRAFNELKNTTAIKTDYFIKVEKVDYRKYNDDGKTYVIDQYLNIVGKAPNNKYYACEFVAWNEWLGMNIELETINNFSKELIVAACLWEMTWNGYTQEDIKEAEREFNNTLEEFEEFIN